MIKHTFQDIKTLCTLLRLVCEPDAYKKLQPLDQIDLVQMFELANRYWLGPTLAYGLSKHPDYQSLNGVLVEYCQQLIELGQRRSALQSKGLKLSLIHI